MREEILEIAQEQMKAGGYNYLNFGAIAKQLKTTRANLHYHFKNKETLAIEVTKRFIADQEAEFIKTAARFPGNFPGLMEASEEHLWGHRDCHGATGSCICQQLISEPDIPQSLLELAKKHFKNFLSILTEQIIESQKAGVIIEDVVPSQMAIECSSIFFGLEQMSQFIDDEDIIKIKGTLKNWVSKYKK